MRSGEMRHKLVIQAASETADGIGGVTVEWGDSFTVYGKQQQLSGNERLETQKLTGHNPVRFFVYYDSRITQEHRIKWMPDGTATTKYLSIRGVFDTTGQRRSLILDCLEDQDA